MTEARAAVEAIASALPEMDLEFERVSGDRFVVALPGEKRLKTACWLTVGTHALEIEAFVMRKADENRERVYAYLLQRNVRMYVVSWAIDAAGDVYLTGSLPLSAAV